MILARIPSILRAVVPLALLATGCAEGDAASAPGVDTEARVLRIGALNDESGPAAAIGRPFAEGVRIAVQQANVGELGNFPADWQVELVERDHGYNAQRSVQAYNEIRDRVLFFAVSFGTPNTVPLQPMLERDGMVAFPASLSSVMARHANTPPTAPSYRVEAMRAMDWAVEHAGGAANVRAGIVYQQDDYGQDGLEGWRQAAAHHGVEVVSEQAISAGQTDLTAVVTQLRAAGADHVLLTVLPSSTAPILGTAAQLGYAPVWIGQTPSWVDAFFDPEVIPPTVFANFHWVMGTPYWGEDVPGMAAFVEAHERLGGPDSAPDFYKLAGYVQTLIGLEVFGRALENDAPTREGYLAALHSLQGWDAGGMIQPIDLSAAPYVTGTRTRILRPVMGEARWEPVGEWAEPAPRRAN